MKTKTETTIMDRLKNGYPDACKLLKREPLTLEQFKQLYPTEEDANAFFALHKITTVIEAINEGHQFNWNDNGEFKYYPWWDMETYGDASAGSGFSLRGVVCVSTATTVGARLSMRTREHANFVAELMLQEYKIWMKK
jgi:hypothetical protein